MITVMVDSQPVGFDGDAERVIRELQEKLESSKPPIEAKEGDRYSIEWVSKEHWSPEMPRIRDANGELFAICDDIDAADIILLALNRPTDTVAVSREDVKWAIKSGNCQLHEAIKRDDRSSEKLHFEHVSRLTAALEVSNEP